MENKSDNAAYRESFAGSIYQHGAKSVKTNIFAKIPEKYSQLHSKGYIHIHDAEAYGRVNNCSSPDLLSFFESVTLSSKTDHGKMLEIISMVQNLITNVASNQSGGIGFVNFDRDIGFLLNKYEISINLENIEFYRDCILNFLVWINTTRTRLCREPYYLSLNIGLSSCDWGKITARILLECFYNLPMEYTRPNIIFKVNRKINSANFSPNYDIFQLALKCTAKRMIPTYLLTDSAVNSTCDPKEVGIMGCRTRVYDNTNGNKSSIGRGNIANVSVNLPRIALENRSINEFYIKLNSIMVDVTGLLIDRVNKLVNSNGLYMQYTLTHKIWGSSDTIEKIVNQGTISIGFIGLSEAVEILTGEKYYLSDKAYKLALNIVTYMRNFIDEFKENHTVNISLLATPGEMISGRFCDIDKKHVRHNIQDKGFYTNSFHVPVDSQISLFEKIDYEAPFHSLCNGGCITYVEFQSAPLTNTIALEDAINYAELKGISYLGFNYPMDICNECKSYGTFDNCPNCNSDNVKRIRRVSGYLEELNYFTSGKKAEEYARKANAI